MRTLSAVFIFVTMLSFTVVQAMADTSDKPKEGGTASAQQQKPAYDWIAAVGVALLKSGETNTTTEQCQIISAAAHLAPMTCCAAGHPADCTQIRPITAVSSALAAYESTAGYKYSSFLMSEAELQVELAAGRPVIIGRGFPQAADQFWVVVSMSLKKGQVAYRYYDPSRGLTTTNYAGLLGNAWDNNLWTESWYNIAPRPVR